jgi:hypothetical protein
MVLTALLAWLDREQREVIAFLREENRVLKAQLGRRRLRLDDEQRRRLAVCGERLSRSLLHEFRDTRHSGHDSSLASGVGGPEMDVSTPTPRATIRASDYSASRHPDGD